MAEVSLRIDKVFTDKDERIEVLFAVLVNGIEWLSGQVAQGFNPSQVRDNAIEVTRSLILAERKQRQQIVEGQIIPTGLTMAVGEEEYGRV
jgi:hypothetical protein